MKATLRARASDVRCAVCHDRLEGARRLCAGCGTVAHDSCLAELARCPTLGCPGSHRRVVVVEVPPSSRPWVLRALVTASLTFAGVALAAHHGDGLLCLLLLVAHVFVGAPIAARLREEDVVRFAGAQVALVPLAALLALMLWLVSPTTGFIAALVVTLAVEPVVVVWAARSD
jgi:hypothetical protein